MLNAGAVIALAMYGIRGAPHHSSPVPISELRTTDGAIALGNLDAQIKSEMRLADTAKLTTAQRSGIIELTAQRGQITGQIADYERSLTLAEDLVRDDPQSGLAHLTRSHIYSIFHRFDDATRDLDAAEELGLHGRPVDAARASIFQARGEYPAAIALRERLAARRQDFGDLAALALAYAESGDPDRAEPLFTEAPKHYRDVSPFPIAWLDFERGHLLMVRGELRNAREFFENAAKRLPQYKTAQAHLAQTELALGNARHAVEILRPLVESSDDPVYAGTLAEALFAFPASDTAARSEGEEWKQRAAHRYEDLLSQHPEAFADHAAEFWLAAGADPKRALDAARMNLKVRQTARAYELVLQAALQANDRETLCDTFARAAEITNQGSDLRSFIKAARAQCQT